METDDREPSKCSTYTARYSAEALQTTFDPRRADRHGPQARANLTSTQADKRLARNTSILERDHDTAAS